MLEIDKEKTKNKKTKCKKCGNFLFSTSDNGFLHFRQGLGIVSNGVKFKVKCSCGEMREIILK